MPRRSVPATETTTDQGRNPTNIYRKYLPIFSINISIYELTSLDITGDISVGDSTGMSDNHAVPTTPESIPKRARSAMICTHERVNF